MREKPSTVLQAGVEGRRGMRRMESSHPRSPHTPQFKGQDIVGEIGEVIIGGKPGRVSDREITLFDSTGIALQDSATVPLEYERAVAAGVGVEKKMIST